MTLNFLLSRIARVLTAVLLVTAVTAPAYADDVLKKIDLETSPIYWVNAAGDANAPPPTGYKGMGYNTNNPGAHDWRLDYGLNYHFDRQTSFFYTHDVLDYQIDRILTYPSPKAQLSLVSGDVSDRIDRIGFNHVFTRSVSARAYFLDHERSIISGFCLNQLTCNGKANPNVADMHGYGVGSTYNFAPWGARSGPLFTAALDAQYIPRPDVPPSPADRPSSNGMQSWTGSKMLYPYSLIGMMPFSSNHSLMGVLGYARTAEYFRNNSSQALYNVVSFGLIKSFTKSFSVSLMDYNYKECTCSDTVPPPDNLRAAGVAMKFIYKFSPAAFESAKSK